MYVPLKNYSVITKSVSAIITGALRFVLNFKWTYIRSFFLFLFKLTCALTYSLAKCFLGGFKDSCFEKIVIPTDVRDGVYFFQRSVRQKIIS